MIQPLHYVFLLSAEDVDCVGWLYLWTVLMMTILMKSTRPSLAGAFSNRMINPGYLNRLANYFLDSVVNF